MCKCADDLMSYSIICIQRLYNSYIYLYILTFAHSYICTFTHLHIHYMKSVYFIGAGGIGMSALERYFLSKGLVVAGYDRTSCELTEELRAEGADIH